MRGPLHEYVFYVDEGYVLKTFGLNIGEGGLFLENFPKFPSRESFSMMLSLPQIPLFSILEEGEWKTVQRENLEAKVFRSEGKITRSLQDYSETEKVFINRMAVEFTDIETGGQEAIRAYMALMHKNIVYLLSLFEKEDDCQKQIISFANLLGYTETDDFERLRNILLHDYQSLQVNP